MYKLKVLLNKLKTFMNKAKGAPPVLIRKIILFPEYVLFSFSQKNKKLTESKKTIVFTLEQDRLYRDVDGMGRYAYLTLNAFSEAGYNVYLHKNVDTFQKFAQLGKYGRYIHSIKNLKLVSQIPEHIRPEETVYAFDTIDQGLLRQSWQKIIYVNMSKPTFCRVGQAIWIPYSFHAIAYKNGIHRNIHDLRSNENKLRIFFAGNAAQRYYSSKRLKEQYNQLTRHEGIQAVQELQDKVHCVENLPEFYRSVNSGKYIKECWLVKTDQGQKLKLSEYWEIMSKSDFFLCFSGTDLPMCHNAIEAMAVGAIPIISYPDWFSPPLEHGKNALIYSSKEDLKTKVKEALNMTDTEIRNMRSNVIKYHDEHLSNDSFIRSVEANPDRIITIMLHPKYVSVQKEDEVGKQFMQELTMQVNGITNRAKMLSAKEGIVRPLVSIVIPAYNRASKISAALSSIQAQTYPNWEAIVVDDGSTDKTCDVVSEMAGHDERIRLVRHPQNRKAQAARNTGIRSAKGEWIAFLDSDDEYLPDSIRDRLTLAEKEHVPVVHSECYILKPGQEKQLYKVRPLSGNIYKEILEKEGPVFPALFVKKNTLEDIGLLDEKIKAYQEWDTAIRLAKNNRFAFCPKPTFIYDYRCDDSMSRDSILNGKGYKQILHKHYFEIWKDLGMKGLAYHYDRIAEWYEKGNDKGNAGRYKLLAAICKCLSFKMIRAKLSLLVFKKAY